DWPNLEYAVSAVSGSPPPGQVVDGAESADEYFSSVASTAAALPPDVQALQTSEYERALRLQFSEDVSTSLIPSDIQLLNLTTGSTVGPASFSLQYSADDNVATITFGGSHNS